MVGLRTARWVLFAACAVLAVSSGSAAAREPRSVYEWLRPAPIVVIGKVTRAEGRYYGVTVQETLRGTSPVGSSMDIAVRRANVNRSSSQDKLDLKERETYVFLLEPDVLKKKRSPPVPRYRLVRGVEGVRAVPREGAPAFLDALSRLVEIQDRKDEPYAWQRFEEMLEETNPYLLETALEQFLRYRRGPVRILPLLRPLLDHPRPDIRRRAVQVVAVVLERNRDAEIPDGDGLWRDLVSHARRDSDVQVRVQSTLALAQVERPGLPDVLREIATHDPDQMVRYQAERILYQRRQRRRDTETPARKGGGPAPR